MNDLHIDRALNWREQQQAKRIAELQAQLAQERASKQHETARAQALMQERDAEEHERKLWYEHSEGLGKLLEKALWQLSLARRFFKQANAAKRKYRDHLQASVELTQIREEQLLEERALVEKVAEERDEWKEKHNELVWKWDADSDRRGIEYWAGCFWQMEKERDVARQSRARLVCLISDARKFSSAKMQQQGLDIVKLEQRAERAEQDARALLDAWKSLRENPNDENHLAMLNLSIQLRSKYRKDGER